MGVLDPILEQEAMGEDEAIRQCIAAAVERVKTQYPPEKNAIMRRDAHPKHHGIVRGILHVDSDVPPELRYGIFLEPGSYKSWIRFSNGSPTPSPDIKKDARGMAIKVCEVEGPRANSDPGVQTSTQDFIMIDHPVFFIRDPRQYAPFIRLEARGKGARFFVGWNPCRWHLRQGLIARRLQHTIASPLENSYFSMSPYKLGAHAVKFSVRYRGSRHAVIPSNPSDHFLRDAMRDHLRRRAALFDFMVQLRTHPRVMPIEDPTRQWSEKLSPFRKVATIEIPSQRFDSDQQLRFAENVSYNPWNSLLDHAPLGGINRLRLAVYEAISRLRHETNGTPNPLALTGDESFGADPTAITALGSASQPVATPRCSSGDVARSKS